MMWLATPFAAACVDIVFFGFPLTLAQSLQPQIPSVQSFTPAAGQKPFILSSSVQITVDSQWQNYSSPSLNDYAETFRADLMGVLRFTSALPLVVAAASPDSTRTTIFLTLDPTANFTLYNGKPTDEGYDFTITSSTYTISAPAPIGVWWGTRTLLQQAAMIANSVGGNPQSVSIPAGSGTDSPGWEIRGFMLDAGRHAFFTSFLSDLCTYASFFKLNEFHLHASDYVWNGGILNGPDWMSLYAGFRFTPSPTGPNAGLVPNTNESWTQEYFQLMQSSCNNHGVTLIPEIDTPAHSLEITKWKPNLMLAGHPDFLDLSNPETLPTVQGIWTEFLPWFTAPEVSIGADEYASGLADEYITFINNMASFFTANGGKKMRVWGTNQPSSDLSISTNVTIQHWDYPTNSIPVQLMNKGYSVINSDIAFLYLDGKTSTADGQLPWELSQDLMWGGAPGGAGWAPNIFTQTDASNNAPVDAPLLRGSIMALWNDWGNNASTELEEYYQLSRSFAVFAEKSWAGSGVRNTSLTRDQFNTIYPILNVIAPGQNLNRAVTPMSGNVVYSYTSVPTLPLVTNFSSVGPPYTFKFTITPSASAPTAGTIFTGIDSVLQMDGLTFRDVVTGDLFPLAGGWTLPSGQATTVEIHATTNATYAIIGGKQYSWTSQLSLWGVLLTKDFSFAAPSLMFGGDGFEGSLSNVELSLGA